MPPADAPRDTSLHTAMRACRAQFAVVGLFSGVVNLLQLTVSLYMMQVFDRVLSTRSLDTLFYLTLIAVAAIGLLALLDALRAQVMQRIGQWAEARLGAECFARALESRLRGRAYGVEALRDLGLCRAWLGSPAALALYDVPWVPVYLLVILALSPVLGLVALGGAALLLALTLANEFATARLLREAGAAALASQRRTDAIARNAEVIDSMGMQPAVLARWQAGLDAALPPARRAAGRAGLLLGITKFVRLAVQVALLGVGAWLVLQQDITAGASIAGSIIMGRALAPVEQMIGGWKQLVQARQSWRRLVVFLSAPRIRPAGTALPAPRAQLVAERVAYAFPGQGAAAIRGVSFALEAGESLAIIGPSAAGKTTLARLLIGTLEPGAGHVRLDGADVFAWLREDLGRHIGYLPQDVELLDGTVADNIARMGPAAPEEVVEAAQMAGCHAMILRLPQGYATRVGEGGQPLSGGQRQMIGLARALFGRPRLVVLDEPNSNLDGDAEQALLAALRMLKEAGATVVLVSHRPTLVQGVDRVLLLKDGMAERFGPRAEVLTRLMQPVRPQPVPLDRPAHG